MTVFPPGCRQQQCLLRLVSPIPNQTLWYRTISPRRTRHPVTRKFAIICLVIFISSFAILYYYLYYQPHYKWYSRYQSIDTLHSGFCSRKIKQGRCRPITQRFYPLPLILKFFFLTWYNYRHHIDRIFILGRL